MVRLINCFEVPPGRDEEFMALFRAVNAHMAAKPGFVGDRLHRSLSPDARYRFVNYVEWESSAHLSAARDDRFRELTAGVLAGGFTSISSLYEIVHEVAGRGAAADDRAMPADHGGADDPAGAVPAGQGPNTHEMTMTHRVYRATLAEGPHLIRTVAAGDQVRARQVADHIGMVLQSLHHHHVTEDALLWPLLSERAPQRDTLVAMMEAQHAAIADGLTRAQGMLATWAAGADPLTGARLADALDAVAGPLNAHLDEEEANILPLCAEHVSVPEWARLREEGIAGLDTERQPLFLGLMLENMSDSERTTFLDHMPPPAVHAWTTEGQPRFDTYITGIRSANQSTPGSAAPGIAAARRQGEGDRRSVGPRLPDPDLR